MKLPGEVPIHLSLESRTDTNFSLIHSPIDRFGRTETQAAPKTEGINIQSTNVSLLSILSSSLPTFPLLIFALLTNTLNK